MKTLIEILKAFELTAVEFGFITDRFSKLPDATK